ncbi:hypothetical protein PuT2_14125 [Pusillimonas sp. T2]|uniref:hypothetical protein n=1 Tax=Pusillimonas sp. T2 TaxID=1548123 RepID=UPI000B9CEBED|nr:hypothetical protein [Pusillimonas sp. T2]OXR48156.1 hypothetical protein PuT2_14125 [Pusillimonas sp. T2]
MTTTVQLRNILDTEQDALAMAYADILNQKESGWTPKEALKDLVFMVQTTPEAFEALLPRLREQANVSMRGRALFSVHTPG